MLQISANRFTNYKILNILSPFCLHYVIFIFLSNYLCSVENFSIDYSSV